MPTQPIKADDLFAAWSRGQFQKIYLFTGQEDFLIEDAVKRLTAHVLPDDPSGANRDRLDAEDHSAEEILQTAQTMPFGSPIRFIEVRNVGRLSAEDQKFLAQGIAQLPETTQLVLIWGKEWRRDDGERPLVKAVLQTGAVVIFWPLYPESAQRWLVSRAKTYKKTLLSSAAAWLVQEAGESLRQLDQELSKACGYVGERTEITQDDLEICFGYQKAQSPFEWVNALKQKKPAQSLRMLRQLLEDDEEPLKLIAMAQYAVRDAVKNGGERPEGLSYCVEAHQSIKSGKETPTMALTLLTLRLCGLDSLHA